MPIKSTTTPPSDVLNSATPKTLFVSPMYVTRSRGAVSSRLTAPTPTPVQQSHSTNTAVKVPTPGRPAEHSGFRRPRAGGMRAEGQRNRRPAGCRAGRESRPPDWRRGRERARCRNTPRIRSPASSRAVHAIKRRGRSSNQSTRPRTAVKFAIVARQPAARRTWGGVLGSSRIAWRLPNRRTPEAERGYRPRTKTASRSNRSRINNIRRALR
jgi:hypothetical protein